MGIITQITSRDDLQNFLAANPKAILGFHASWVRGSASLVESVLLAAATAAATPATTTTSETGGKTACWHAKLEVGRLDVGLYEDLAFEAAEVGSVLPCFNFYRDGRRVGGVKAGDGDGDGSGVGSGNGGGGRGGGAGSRKNNTLEGLLNVCLGFVRCMDQDDDNPPSLPPSPPPPPPFHLLTAIPPGEPILLFIAGDRSKVGKSSICLALLGSLLQLGFAPSHLAYIKPATQCEAPQLVTAWCDAVGIANRGVGPVVFYKGFTREFLKGNIGTSTDLVNDACAGVHAIGKGKKIVLVDGVGYPAVGSICGVSNADIALALGDCPVLLVGRAGVGDAVDSFNLNATFFKYIGVRVLGAVFNRLPKEGFYSLEACREAVGGYFEQYQQGQQGGGREEGREGGSKAYGFVPEVEELGRVREEMEEEHARAAAVAATGEGGGEEGREEGRRMRTAEVLIETFRQHVDLEGLLNDAWEYRKERRAQQQQPQQQHVVGVGGGGGGGVGWRAGVIPSVPTGGRGGGGGRGGETSVVSVPSIMAAVSVSAALAPAPAPAPVAVAEAEGGGGGGGGGGMCAYVPGQKRKSREEIEQAAKKQGAKGG